MTELIFRKDYELLQEIGYPHNGSEKRTKSVILLAPTFKQSEEIESAIRQLDAISAIINCICKCGLIVTKDGETPIAAPFLNGLHIKAYRDLADKYCQFFLVSEQ